MNQWQIGKVRISQVVEIGPSPTSPKFFFKQPPDDLVARHPWLKPHFANDEDRLLLEPRMMGNQVVRRVLEKEPRRRRRRADLDDLRNPDLADLPLVHAACLPVETGL